VCCLPSGPPLNGENSTRCPGWCQGTGAGEFTPTAPPVYLSFASRPPSPQTRRMSPTISNSVRASLRALLPLAVLLPFAGTVEAQTVEDLLIPRGAILLEVRSSHTQASRVFDGEGGRHRFAPEFRTAPFSPATFPALEAEEDRLRALLDNPSASLSLGRIHGRFHVNEQHTPFRVGWGVIDRVTVGATVPFVRRRVTSSLDLHPEGANSGINPAQGQSASEVAAFRSEAAEALQALQSSVAATCQDQGSGSESCLQGQETLDRLSGFVDLLGSAWDDALLFPLEGSGVGEALRGRWAGALDDLSQWGVSGPESIPLATTRLSGSALRSDFVDPLWGGEGFPTSTPDYKAELGDVKLHLVVGLIDIRAGGNQERISLRSAAELSIRFPTGAPDSMALLTPLEPPRGYGGGGVRLVTDLVLDDRLGILSEVELESYSDRSFVLLGADPANPWNPDAVRRTLEGAPGDRTRVRITPRYILVPGLALGAGWEWDRGGEGRWSPVEADLEIDDSVVPGIHRHRGSVELRFAGWDSRFAGHLPFPIELLARASRTFSGSAGAPDDRRIEIGARVLRGGW
jgi:hypothetical protein